MPAPCQILVTGNAAREPHHAGIPDSKLMPPANAVSVVPRTVDVVPGRGPTTPRWTQRSAKRSGSTPKSGRSAPEYRRGDPEQGLENSRAWLTRSGTRADCLASTYSGSRRLVERRPGGRHGAEPCRSAPARPVDGARWRCGSLPGRIGAVRNPSGRAWSSVGGGRRGRGGGQGPGKEGRTSVGAVRVALRKAGPIDPPLSPDETVIAPIWDTCSDPMP